MKLKNSKDLILTKFFIALLIIFAPLVFSAFISDVTASFLLPIIIVLIIDKLLNKYRVYKYLKNLKLRKEIDFKKDKLITIDFGNDTIEMSAWSDDMEELEYETDKDKRERILKNIMFEVDSPLKK
jgi:hypothetical protein